MPDKAVSKDDGPLYLQVLATVRRRIGNGTYRGRISTEKALAEELGVAQGTVAHALQVLKEDGILVSRRGHGTEINWRVLDSEEPTST